MKFTTVLLAVCAVSLTTIATIQVADYRRERAERLAAKKAEQALANEAEYRHRRWLADHADEIRQQNEEAERQCSEQAEMRTRYETAVSARPSE